LALSRGLGWREISVGFRTRIPGLLQHHRAALLCFAVGGGLLFAFLILIARPARPDRVVALRAA